MLESSTGPNSQHEHKPKGVLTTLRGSYLAAIANAFEGKYV